MNKFNTFLLGCTLLISGMLLKAQNLPESMHFSADGRRLITGNKPSEKIYDESQVPRIDLQFGQTDYWQQMTANYTSKTDIPASLTYNGKTYYNVGIRFRGNTSYQRVTTQKKSFSITLDYQDSTQDVNGYETLHLNNAFEDQSQMREVLYLGFNRRHIPAAKGNFVNLYINGQNWGLYSNVQALNGEFMDEWFLSKNGTRWRAERTTTGGTPGAGGNFGAGTSSLNFLGADAAVYKTNYALKHSEKTDPWAELVAACAALNNPVEDQLKKVLDTDRALWYIAHEIMFGDDDSYVNKGGMDYYVFWDEATKRVVPIEYDGNSAFNSIGASWSPFLKETDTKYPLMNKLFAVPALRQRYLAHFRTMIEESLEEDFFSNKIDSYYNLIESYVKNDPKKLYTYDQFVAGRNTLKNWLRNRKTFLMNNTEVNRPYPAISDVVYYNNSQPFVTPISGQKVTVTAKINSTNGINGVNLYYSTGLDGFFEKTNMSDDGTNGDSVAGDGMYTGILPAYEKGTYVRYYVEAVANDAFKTVSYMPKGAEHDVYIYQVIQGVSNNTNIVINELMADNKTIKADQNGQFNDWVELYNKSNVAVDLSGWFLSDNPDKRGKWQLPNGTTIPANGYLIVWADEDSSQVGLHTNFKLAAGGETLFLSDKDTLKVDEISFGQQRTDISYARKPNGTGNFGFFSPTFSMSNDSAISPTTDIAESAVKLYPNPATEEVTIEVGAATPVRVKVFNMLGQVMYDNPVLGQELISTQNWSKGTYFFRVGNVSKKLMVQ